MADGRAYANLAVRHHAGQPRPAEQDADGARRLYAERALGADRLRQGRRHGRRRHIGRDPAGRRRRGPVAGRAFRRGQPVPAAVDAGRGGAPRPVRDRRQVDAADGRGRRPSRPSARASSRPTRRSPSQPAGARHAAEAAAGRGDVVAGSTCSPAGASASRPASRCPSRRRRCSRLELTQMAQRVPEVEEAIADPELPLERDRRRRPPALPRGRPRPRRSFPAAAAVPRGAA